MVYVCYDNEAYMNTGIQRSSSTPRFADATTSPAGKVIPGKAAEQEESDGDHRGPQCSVCGSDDFYRELQGSSRKGAQGHLYSWSVLSQRAVAMSARLALRNTGDLAEICQPCSGNLRMASLRNRRRCLEAELRTKEKASGRRIPEETGSFRSHVQEGQRLDDR